MFWAFHDFRIIDIHYRADMDSIDVIFEYDNRELRILIRFEGNVQMYIAPFSNGFEGDWISGSALYVSDHQLKWMNCEIDELELLEGDEKITYFQGDKIRWALVDGEGNRIPIPDHLIHQFWRALNYETMEYEEETHDFTVIPLN